MEETLVNELLNNQHIVRERTIEVNGEQMEFQYIHQQRPGDCALINFLNTWSFTSDGKLPMSVNEARFGMMNLRKDEGLSPESIRKIDTGLTQEDTALLFSEMYGVKPNWEEDTLRIEGRLDERTRKLKAVDILEYLDTYDSGVCATGLGEHSRSIVKLEGDNYAFLNPTNPDGVSFKNTEGMVTKLADLMEQRPPEDNFFFFVRS